MESEKLVQLCQSLSLLEEEEETIVVDRSITKLGEEKLTNSLVGKILSHRLINRDGLRSAVQKMWRTMNEVKVESLGGNRFIFQFHSEIAKRRILLNGPWHFDKSLIVLVEPKGVGDVSQISFTNASFWIQIHNIPILCMNRETESYLGSLLRRVEDVDSGETGDCLGKFLRVRVNLDITKPLRRVLRVKFNTEEGTCTIMPLLYEKLLFECFGF